MWIVAAVTSGAITKKLTMVGMNCSALPGSVR